MLVNNPLLLTTGALLFGALSIATPEQASADVRVRVNGGVTVRTHPRSSYRPAYRPVYRPAYRPSYRPYYRPTYSVGGSIWIGGGTYYGGYEGYRTYAAPPPAPSCNCGPGAVPSYYPGYYSQPGYTTATAVSAEPRELPRFAIGGYAGGYDLDGQEGSDVGFIARLRLTDGLLVEGELGASELKDNQGDPDSRAGASLIYELGARNTWAPYLVGGAGATRNEYTTESLGFAELGVGLRWALTDNLHLAFDIRAGAQERSEYYETLDVAERVILPNPTDDDDEDAVQYTRGRLSALLYF
jgi:hypothetical protein